jgi:hypothetical protein
MSFPVCSRKQPKSFAFDHCFNSVDPTAEKFASQEIVFDCLGRDILDNAFQGYNACIFAYGQTGECLSLIGLECKCRLCSPVARVPGYTTEMYCASCEVQTEFIYVM